MDTRLKRSILKGLAAGLGLAASVVFAATFSLFQPANGILVGNSSTYVTTAAASSNITALFSGCSGISTQYLAADGSCQPVSAAVSGANPTASLGLTAINGSATTYMRSDAAPALSQSIAPTWTGLHLFTGNATAGQIQLGASGAYSAPSVNRAVFNYDTSGGTLTIDANARSSAGSTAIAFNTTNAGTDANAGIINSNGGMVWGGATGGNKGAGTINAVGLYVGGVAVGTGGGSPGGSSGQFQYNNGGTFGGTTNINFDSTHSGLEIGATATTSSAVLLAIETGTRGGGNNFVQFQDSTGTKADIGYTGANDDFWILNIPNTTLRLGTNNTDILDIASGSIVTSVSFSATKTNAGSGIQVAAQNNDATTNGTFAQDIAANSSHSFHHLITGTAQTSAFITGGFASEAAYLYTDAGVPLCIGTGGSCRENITAAGAVSIATPSSGFPLTLNNTTSGSNVTLVSESSDAAYQLSLGYNYGTANVINSSGSVARPLQIEIGNTVYATWNASGALALSASAGNTLSVTGVAAQATAEFQSSTTTNSGFGPRIDAGTSGSDYVMYWGNAAATTERMRLYGDGGLTVGSGVTGGDQGAGSINVSSGYALGGAFAAGGIFGAKIIYGYITGNGSGCTMTNAVGASGCTRAATGRYNFTPTAGSWSSMACSASPDVGASTTSATVGATNGGSGGVQVYNGSTAADGNVSFICISK